MMYDGSASATPVQQQPMQHRQQQQQHAFMDNLFARQANIAAREDSRLSQNSPAATILGSRSLHSEHSQPLHPSAMPSASTSSNDQNTTTEKIRLNLTWDRTILKVWLEMNAPCEAFFRTFQQLVEKRKGIFERADITIYLKKDNSTPDDEAYPLSLDEDELKVDWKDTLSWLRDNTGETVSENVYGRVQVGEG